MTSPTTSIVEPSGCSEGVVPVAADPGRLRRRGVQHRDVEPLRVDGVLEHGALQLLGEVRTRPKDRAWSSAVLARSAILGGGRRLGTREAGRSGRGPPSSIPDDGVVHQQREHRQRLVPQLPDRVERDRRPQHPLGPPGPSRADEAPVRAWPSRHRARRRTGGPRGGCRRAARPRAAAAGSRCQDSTSRSRPSCWTSVTIDQSASEGTSSCARLRTACSGSRSRSAPGSPPRPARGGRAVAPPTRARRAAAR